MLRFWKKLQQHDEKYIADGHRTTKAEGRIRRMRKIKQLIEAALSVLFRNCVIYNSKISSKAVVRKKCRVYNSTIGDYSYVTRNTLIHNAQIGKYCSISENCVIGTPSHPTDMVSTSPVFCQGKNYLKKNFAQFKHESCKKTVIGNDVWIGLNCLIRDGITVADGAIIGMGSVVTKNVGPYEIWAGIPAIKIKTRFDAKTIEGLLALKWWEWPEDRVAQFADCFDDPEKLLQKLQEYSAE